MSVRSAVATTSNNHAPATVSPQQAVKRKIDEFRPIIAKLLVGTGVTEETFVAQISTACRAVPALWNCTPESVLGAALKAAQFGLAPNDARNQCWILPYGREAQWQLGYGGVMELARRAVPGLRFDGRPVFPNDDFDVDFGKAEPLLHRPAVVKGQQRGGDAYAWYVRATFPDGSTQVHVLDKEGVEYHRAFSKQKTGTMWSKSYDAAALKSVVLDMRRWLPSSTTLTAAFASDETVVDVRTIEADPDVIDIDAPDDTPAPAADQGSQEPPADFTPMTDHQRKHLHALLREKHNATGDARFPILTSMLGRTITSTNEIDAEKAAWLIDELKALPHPEGEPTDVGFQ